MFRVDLGPGAAPWPGLWRGLLAAVLLAPGVAWWAVHRGAHVLVWPDLHSALMSLVLAPCLEEAVMRCAWQTGLLQAALRRGCSACRADLAAAAGAAVAFALIHLDGFSGEALLRCTPWLLPGAVLALAWCWRRRLSDCVFLHAYFNALLALFSLR